MSVDHRPAFHRAYTAALAEELDFPGAIKQRVLIPASATGGTLALFEDEVAAGIGPPRHIHHGQDEAFMVEEGQFLFEIDGARSLAGPGDAAFVPRGTVHAFRNIGDGPGRLRFAFTPALVIEDMFRRFHEIAGAGGLSAEQMTEIAAEHGQEMVGPPLEP